MSIIRAYISAVTKAYVRAVIPGNGGYNSTEVDAYITGLATPLSAGQVANLRTLVVALKSGIGITNLSDFFDTFYVLAGETAESSLKNLVKDLHHCIPVNNPTFTQFEGYAGNATNSYLRTQYIPETHGVNYSLNSASIGVYNRTVRDVNNSILLGSRESSSSKILSVSSLYTGGYSRALINYNVSAQGTVSNPGDSSGMYIFNRTSDTAVNIYRNNIDLGSAFSQPSSGLPNKELWICGFNNNGSYLVGTTDQIAIVFTAKGVANLTQATVISNAIEDYMDANGKGFIWLTEPVLTEEGYFIIEEDNVLNYLQY